MKAYDIFPAIIIVLAAGTGYLCAQVAGRMALGRGRPAKKWAIWAAMWGPVPLVVLALLPKRRPIEGHRPQV
jgi:hypothetical protein